MCQNRTLLFYYIDIEAKKVIKLLQTTRLTPCSYVKNGIVNVTESPNRCRKTKNETGRATYNKIE